MFESILIKAKELLTWKVLLPCVALIIMFFTPDNIDKVIIDFLRVLGVSEDILGILAKLGSSSISEAPLK